MSPSCCCCVVRTSRMTQAGRLLSKLGLPLVDLSLVFLHRGLKVRTGYSKFYYLIRRGKNNNNNSFVLYLISMYKYSWLNILKGMEQICPPPAIRWTQSRSPDVSCGLRLPSAAGLVSLLNHNSGARPTRRNASLSSRRHFRRFNLLLLFLDASIA